MNGQCDTNSQCPLGQHSTLIGCLCNGTNVPPVNNQCSDECPSGFNWVNGQCVIFECPTGYVLNSSGTACELVGGCNLPNACSSDRKRVVNGCNGGTVQACSAQQTCINAQCITVGAEIKAIPSLVRRGEFTNITWKGTNVTSCAVSEDNPTFVTPQNSLWSCSNAAACEAGQANVRTEGAMDQRTIYTILCIAQSGATASATATVQVIPIWDES